MPVWNQSVYDLLIALALKGTAILCAAWLLAAMFKKCSAAFRHLVWTAASAALLLLPVLALSMPALRLPLSRALPAVVFQTASASAPAVPDAQPRARLAAPVAHQPATWSPDWRLALMLLWGAGAAAGLAQMLVGWALLRRIRRTSHPFAEPDLTMHLRTLGIDRHVQVLSVREGSMPMAFGLLRPAVFLPADAAGWSAERRRLVLLHELAHIQRRDITHPPHRTSGAEPVLVEPAGLDRVARVHQGTRTRRGRPGVGSGSARLGLRGPSARHRSLVAYRASR